MITFYLGRPGSGKSYYAVDKIYNNFSDHEGAKKDKKFKYDICYTNINEFEFDKVENVFLLDFDDLKSKLTILHSLYKKKSTDEDLIEKCKEFNILNAFFVIDESQNFFSSRDTVLIWWLSYHRHLFHEIILITQNLALIESKYKSFSEFFYEARPASLTLDKRYFFYSVYCSSRLTKASKSGVIKIKRNPEVFELYRSGDSIGTHNVLLKILLMTLILFIFLAIGFYFYTDSMKSSNTKDTKQDPGKAAAQNTQNIKPLPPQTATQHFLKNSSYTPNILNNDDYSTKKFFILNCSSMICKNDVISIPPQLLKNFIKSKDIRSLYVQTLSKTLTRHYCESSSSFYTYLSQKEFYNDVPHATDNALSNSISIR
jgi:zona occludens toxin